MYKSGRDQDQDQAASSWLVTGQQRSEGGSHNGAFLEAGLYQTSSQTQALSDSLRNGHSSVDLFCPQLTKQWKSKYPVKNRKNRQWPSRAVQICPLNNFCTRSGPMLHIVTHETKSVNGRFPELWATSHQIASSLVSKCVASFLFQEDEVWVWVRRSCGWEHGTNCNAYSSFPQLHTPSSM